MAGISNANPAQIRQAQEILGGRLVVGAEPVLAGLPLAASRAAAVRRAGHRVPAVEPARRHQQGRRPRLDLRAVRRRSPHAHGVSPQQVAPGLDAGHVPGGHPDPGVVAARDRPRPPPRSSWLTADEPAAALHHRLSPVPHDAVRRPAAGGRQDDVPAGGGRTTGSRRAAAFRRMAGHLRTPTPKRTYRAPHPRGRHPACRPRRPDRHARRAGWPGGAITAAWRSSTCATRRGVVQVVVRDEVLAEGGAHDLRNEYCVQVTGEVAPAARGQRQPRPADR